MRGIVREDYPLILGLWAVPVSIAVAEFFLSIAALLQLIRWVRGQRRASPPRSLWFWLLWVGLTLVMWGLSPEPSLGWSEVRHLLLLAGVLVAVSAFRNPQDLVTAWKGIFITATISSAYLIGEFIIRLHRYQKEIAAGGDASFYLRSGGLVSHWMVYGTIEVVVVAGLISFLSAYPNRSRYWIPLVLINAVAVVLSLTRMAWITCFLLLLVHLFWARSRWIWAALLLPLVIYGIAPTSIRERIVITRDLNYYSNAERLQMLQVGWTMMREHPWTGVGPGRVEKLYESYMPHGDPVPAYHGHLHNNIIQTAAQFGIPVTVAALLFLVMALRDLLKVKKAASNPDTRFVANAALLALIGFFLAGMLEYTYGHSLGLIIITFAIFPPLVITTR